MESMNIEHDHGTQKIRQSTENMFRTVALLLMFSLFAGCAATTKDVVSHVQRNPDWAMLIIVEGVPNLHKINDGVYRSAQPSEMGMQNLEKMGIKTVINLREFHDDKDEVKGTNLKRIDIPMYAWDIKDKKIIEALKQLKNKEDGPYLIHCMHGADRTGVVSAMYRIIYDHWDKQRAIDELRNGGYGFHEVWVNIIDYIKKVDVDAMKQSLE